MISLEWLTTPMTLPTWFIEVLAVALGFCGMTLLNVSLALRRQCRMNARLLAERDRMLGPWLIARPREEAPRG